MIIHIKVGKRAEPFGILRAGLGDVTLTLEDKKRKVYINPHFMGGKELDTVLRKYEDVLPWYVTDEMRKEVVDAFTPDIINFLNFFFNLK
jgi:hypothetical protein